MKHGRFQQTVKLSIHNTHLINYGILTSLSKPWNIKGITHDVVSRLDV